VSPDRPVPCGSRLAIASLIVLLGDLQSLLDKFDIQRGRPDSARRLLLKSVENVDHLRKSNDIDDPIRVPCLVLDELKDTGAQTLPWLSGRVLSAELGDTERGSYLIFDRGRKGKKILLRRADPVERFLSVRRPAPSSIIP